MKAPLSFFLAGMLWLLLMPVRGQGGAGPQEEPSLSEVIEAFFERYAFEKEYPLRLRFAHKPEGWTVYESSYAEPELMQGEQLFWSRNTHSYQSLTYPPATGIESVRSFEVERYLDEYAAELYDFERCPYYGYYGWEEDVIEHWGKAKNLDDRRLEGLGRAYTSAAMGLLRSQFAYHRPSGRQTGYEEVSSSLKRRYLKYTDKAIAAYRQLARQNPGYETLTGNAWQKYSDTHLTAFHILKSIKADKMAQRYLVPGLYNDSTLASAKGLLDACSEDAILITQGDSDTYPLWYVQEMEAYRQDVRVINHNLLRTSYYLAMLAAAEGYTYPLPLSIPPDRYRENSLQFVYLQDSDTSLELEEMIDFVADTDTANKLKIQAAYYDYFPARRYWIPVAWESVKQLPYLENAANAEMAGRVQGKLEGSYVLRDAIILLDILACNAWRIPIHFARTVPPSQRLGLDAYLHLRGNTYLLLPYPEEPDNK